MTGTKHSSDRRRPKTTEDDPRHLKNSGAAYFKRQSDHAGNTYIPPSALVCGRLRGDPSREKNKIRELRRRRSSQHRLGQGTVEYLYDADDAYKMLVLSSAL
jgi:hypothetical protein